MWPFLADSAVIAPAEVVEAMKKHWADSADMDMGTIFVLQKLAIWAEPAFDLFGRVLARQTDLDLFISYLIGRHAEADRHEAAAKLLGMFWDRLVEIEQTRATSIDKSEPEIAGCDEETFEIAKSAARQVEAAAIGGSTD